LSRLIRYFIRLAIIISCPGLFGLATFTAAHKFREIDIRKVLGASVANINLLQQRDFRLTAFAANVITWPLAWFFLSEWLAGFAYKIHLHPGSFILAAFSSLLVTFSTVFIIAWHASTKNPADAIKWE